MSVFRVEVNAITGETVQVEQLIYQSQDGSVILRDVGVQPPDGYLQVDELTSLLPYKKSLELLNTNYQSDITKLNNTFALAFLANGTSEAIKMAAIRSQYEARKAQHTSDIAALKTQYGV